MYNEYYNEKQPKNYFHHLLTIKRLVTVAHETVVLEHLVPLGEVQLQTVESLKYSATARDEAKLA